MTIDDQAASEGQAESLYCERFSNTIDFGKRKRSKYRLIHGDPKPERPVCSYPRPTRKNQTHRQRNLVKHTTGQSLRGIEVAARMDRLAKQARTA